MISIKDIVNATELFGGTIFKTPGYINLFGVRRLGEVNKFNDTLYYYTFDVSGKVTINEVNGFTTKPGLSVLRAPQNTKGTAILKEGWYRKLWKLGKHKNSYNALVQNSPCVVYRDNNKDDNFDFDSAKQDVGIFGINLHRANERLTSVQVNGWSAGCQVMANPVDFERFMKAANAASKAGQVYFSYMLVRSSSVIK